MLRASSNKILPRLILRARFRRFYFFGVFVLMKSALFVIIGALLLFSAGASADVYTNGLAGCRPETRVDRTSSGRFIWKPLGAHFNNAVIVLPSYYGVAKTDVEIYTAKNHGKIDESRIKSKGDCPTNHECLFAQTYLAGRSGAAFQRKFGAIIVKIAPDIAGTGKECRSYLIKYPALRAEYKG
jgi:hypothetical protein